MGGQATSLITSVETHTLVHAGNFNYANSTGATDYLVDDNASAGVLANAIYFSDGTIASVNDGTNAASSPAGSSDQLTFQVTADVTSGWDYIQLPDPGAGYTLYKVVRSDGTAIPLNDQAWTTDVTLSPTGRSTVDHELHILDDNSTGSYLLYYRPTTATAPTVASISSISSPQSGAIGSVDVTFSEPIDPSTFTTANLGLVLNGGANLIDSSVTIIQDTPATFTIGGLAALTGDDGNYTLSVDANGISDLFGDAGTGSMSTSWATGTDVPVVVSIGAGSAALVNTPVDTVDVVLSEPIEPGSFDDTALTLTLNGGPNLITSGVTVAEIDPTTYQIGGLAGLTAIDGDYELSVSATGLLDGSGNSGVGFLAETWTMDTVGPTIASLPTFIQSPRNIVVPSIDVVFSEPVDPTTFTYQNITYSKEGGPNLITSGITITQLSPTEFEISNFNNLIYPIDGIYTFTVSAAGVMDLAGNAGTGSAFGYLGARDQRASGPDGPGDHAQHRRHVGLDRHRSGHAHRHAVGIGTDRRRGRRDDRPRVRDRERHDFFDAAQPRRRRHTLQVTATDGAGNVSPAATFDVFVATTSLQLLSVTGPTPNPTNTAVGSVDVTFSEPIQFRHIHVRQRHLDRQRRPEPDHVCCQISLVSGSTYEIDGLAGLTAAEGSYTLTFDAAGIRGSRPETARQACFRRRGSRTRLRPRAWSRRCLLKRRPRPSRSPRAAATRAAPTAARRRASLRSHSTLQG